jgi:hypothetical protein
MYTIHPGGTLMAAVSTWSDFLASVRPFLNHASPLESLKQGGFVLGGPVANAFEQPAQHPAFGPDALAVLSAAYGPPPPIDLHLVSQPVEPPQKARAAGGFRAVASADLAVLNEVFAEMWSVRTIPNELTAEDTGKVLTVADLQDACTGVPPNAVLGNLAITSPPVAFPSTITPLNLRLDVPFNLPVDAFASLRGVAHVEQPLEFENRFPKDATRPRIGLSLVAIERLDVNLEISASSALQLRSEEKRRPLELKIASVLRVVALELLVPGGTLSAPGDVSISNSFPNSRVDVSQIGMVSVNSGSKNFVIAGINVVDQQPIDPSKLMSEQLPTGANNLHAVIDQSFASDALLAVVRSGDLARFINRAVRRHVSASEIEVDSASIEFDDTILHLAVRCAAKNACPLKDLNFTARLSASAVIENGTLSLQSSKIDIDVDTLDKIVCTILSGILGPFGVVFTLAVLVFLAAFDPSGRNLEFPTTANSEPLPGSLKDFKISLTQASIMPGSLIADGKAGLVPDILHAFACLRLIAGDSTPLDGATVELLELDSPAPAGDDVQIPETAETERFTRKFIIDESTTYQPLPDQSLGTGVTDKTGFVRFVPPLRSVAGILTDITSKEDVQTGKSLSTTTSTELIEEAEPDFAISVTAADGTVLTRRMLIALNNPGKALGTRDAPLVVSINPPSVLNARQA